MQLLVIRHAIAADREDFAGTGKPDSERPLTDSGWRRMRMNARGLRRAAPKPAAIATSPFARAAETARIVAESLGAPPVETLDALTPGHHPRDLLPWLNQQAADSTVAVVGHEPDLGTLVTWLVAGKEAANVELKKGGVCLLLFRGPADAGGAVLQWLLAPAHLRAIAD